MGQKLGWLTLKSRSTSEPLQVLDGSGYKDERTLMDYITHAQNTWVDFRYFGGTACTTSFYHLPQSSKKLTVSRQGDAASRVALPDRFRPTRHSH